MSMLKYLAAGKVMADIEEIKNSVSGKTSRQSSGGGGSGIFGFDANLARYEKALLAERLALYPKPSPTKPSITRRIFALTWDLLGALLFLAVLVAAIHGK